MMPRTGRRWTDQRIEGVLGNILRAGVILSAVIVLAGGVLYFAQSGGRTPEFHVFQGVPGCTVAGMDLMGGLLRFRGQCIIMLGLLLLIATPVARVLFSAVAFALEGDRTYLVITISVLVLLLLSLLSGVVS